MTFFFGVKPFKNKILLFQLMKVRWDPRKPCVAPYLFCVTDTYYISVQYWTKGFIHTETAGLGTQILPFNQARCMSSCRTGS